MQPADILSTIIRFSCFWMLDKLLYQNIFFNVIINSNLFINKSTNDYSFSVFDKTKERKLLRFQQDIL